MKESKVQIEFVHPEHLTPYANNSKKHPTEQIDKIAQQIAKFGFDQPIVVDRKYVIIKGHGRREAALRLRLREVPVIVTDLNDLEAAAARIADNKVAESAWDEDFLRFEFGSLEREGFNLGLTGFDQDEIDKLMREVLDEETKPVDEPRERYILSVECRDENTRETLAHELRERGLKCQLS